MSVRLAGLQGQQQDYTMTGNKPRLCKEGHQNQTMTGNKARLYKRDIKTKRWLQIKHVLTRGTSRPNDDCKTIAGY